MDQLISSLDVIDGHVAEGLASIRAIGETVRANGQEDTGVAVLSRPVAMLAMRANGFPASRWVFGGRAPRIRGADFLRALHAVIRGAHLVGRRELGRSPPTGRPGALSDPGSGGAHAMAQWALGYVSASPGAGVGRRRSTSFRAVAFGRHAERLDLLLAGAVGPAQVALHAGDPEGAAKPLCDEALRLARAHGEWTFIAPFAVTGVRAHQGAGRPDAAVRLQISSSRAIGPGAGDRPSVDRARLRGLVHLGEGSITAPHARR